MLEFMETFNVDTQPGVLCPCDVLALRLEHPKSNLAHSVERLPAKTETQAGVVGPAFITGTQEHTLGWKMKYMAPELKCCKVFGSGMPEGCFLEQTNGKVHQ
ncbi:mannan-binding lectin serine protease 2-like [Falco naumanni]|uniref:mannan-binding lectin serine protease 2-like n=1 Tax=Falco naumanni TaxID=148594 RepID=UPI001ADE1942|nr:mannan-binding lectin serine protease 2-like [Falco naumanni]